MLSPVPWECVDDYWIIVEPMLELAVKKSQEDFNTANIHYHLMERNMQLWIWIEGSTVMAAAITQIINYPNRKVCQVPFLAGKIAKMWIKSEAIIGEWAKQQGCSQMEGFCREGWLHILQPLKWRKVWITMRKDL